MFGERFRRAVALICSVLLGLQFSTLRPLSSVNGIQFHNRRARTFLHACAPVWWAGGVHFHAASVHFGVDNTELRRLIC